MSDFALYSQPAFILHQQKYRESSLIIDVLTQDFGRFSLIAKGVRKAKSKSAGILRPFVALSLSYVGKADLRTLTDAEMIGLPNELTGLALYCGFYINELICNFLHKDDPHPEVFQDYRVCLLQLAQGPNLESALRIFELNLMENIGYGIDLSYDLHHEKPIGANKKYLFDKDEGLLENSEGQFSGFALLAMAQRQFDDPVVLSEAKLLMRTVIDSHLHGKLLKSRSVINNIVKRL
ncbi:DNA repair protein RecO [Methyloglobulus morosus KoM1]|uniref:DNA repair protein RecO n=1 Tax=Methyloglobulus morosus KoM1 TaxID=1116472 RepID=V5DYG6_9GAMM|nr:DNA repair protein RecO [Methyloglobulus morosus]ESS72366.1 DNA repair protein RecO [Methyloglobulus morosus KoM1]